MLFLLAVHVVSSLSIEGKSVARYDLSTKAVEIV